MLTFPYFLGIPRGNFMRGTLKLLRYEKTTGWWILNKNCKGNKKRPNNGFDREVKYMYVQSTMVFFFLQNHIATHYSN